MQQNGAVNSLLAQISMVEIREASGEAILFGVVEGRPKALPNIIGRRIAQICSLDIAPFPLSALNEERSENPAATLGGLVKVREPANEPMHAGIVMNLSKSLFVTHDHPPRNVLSLHVAAGKVLRTSTTARP